MRLNGYHNETHGILTMFKHAALAANVNCFSVKPKFHLARHDTTRMTVMLVETCCPTRETQHVDFSCDKIHELDSMLCHDGPSRICTLAHECRNVLCRACSAAQHDMHVTTSATRTTCHDVKGQVEFGLNCRKWETDKQEVGLARTMQPYSKQLHWRCQLHCTIQMVYTDTNINHSTNTQL